MNTFPCPKCNRPLPQAGEILIGGEVACPVYQCADCVETVNFLGLMTQAAYTFAVDAQGRAFNPAED